MTVPSDVRVKSSARLSWKNAWSAYCRRRWPGVGGIGLAAKHWGLSEWEARTLYEGNSSQATQERALNAERDKRGQMAEFALGLTVLQIRTQTQITTFVEERRRHEREEFERIDTSLRQMAADLPAVLGVAPPGDC